MSTKILFIFEGEKTEKQITENLTRFFVNEKTIVETIFGAEIYQIYKEIVNDEDLDTFSLLKERSNFNKAILEAYTRNDFAEIYLFFDYDGHSTLATDQKLSELLMFFDNETDKGKLYISYPMVEALKHVENLDTFKEMKVEYCDFKRYKNIVHQHSLPSLLNFNKYDINVWKTLIFTHLMKMNFIVYEEYELPSAIIDQPTIFDSQLYKYINVDQTVAILSAFPVFLHDYYGNKELINRLS